MDVNEKTLSELIKGAPMGSCINRYYRKKFFLHPYRVKQFIRNVKNCYQRITRGYCDCDVWEFFSWFQSVIPNMLIQLSNEHMGYPILLDEWQTLSEEEQNKYWENMLREIAQHIINSDEDRCPQQNEYLEDWSNTVTFDKSEDGFTTMNSDDTLSELMNKRSKEIDDYRIKEIETALDMLKPIFFHLWD